MDDMTDLHRRASDEFGARVKAVAEAQWHSRTPCADWDVRDVVDHVTRFNLAVPRLLDGATIDEMGDIFGADVLGDDPVSAWERSAGPAVEAFFAPGSLEATVHHPVGDIPAAMFLLFRFVENLTHAWDVARAIGGDERLDPDLVKAAYEKLLPLEQMMPASGLFAPKVATPEGATPQELYLALQGRRP